MVTLAVFDDDSVQECLVDNYLNIAISHIQEMQKHFRDYFLEINNTDHDSYPVTKIVTNVIKAIDAECHYTIPDTCSYYPARKDAVDHRVLICTKLKTTMKNLDQKISENADSFGVAQLFCIDKIGIKTRAAQLRQHFHKP